MKKNFLTEEQKQYIIEHYPYEQTRIIAEFLGLSSKQVSGYAWQKGIKKNENFIVIRKDNSLTIEQQDFIFDNFATMTNKEISEKINAPLNLITAFARKHSLRKNNKLLKDNSNIPLEKRQFILEKYPTMLTRDIAKITGLNENLIRAYAYRHGVKRDTTITPIMCEQKNGLTNEQKKFIIQNYANMLNEDIAQRLGLSVEQVHSYASNKKLTKNFDITKTKPHYFEQCIKNRKRFDYDVQDFLGKEKEPKISTDKLYKSKYGKYCVNQDYFEVIDNEWKSYWLGFLYADGCVTIDKQKNTNKKRNCLSISLKEEDKNHLQKFLNSLQSDSVVKIFKTNYKNYNASKITITNEKICNDLIKWGCVPRKTFSLHFPDFLPEHLIRHFIRGFFDGDGGITINFENRTIRINFTGIKEMLDPICQIFREECNANFPVCQPQRGKDNRIFSIQWGNLYTCHKIYQYLYKDANIFLDRKFKKFDTIYCLE